MSAVGRNRRWLNFRRALYEWSTLGSGLFSAVCLVWWIVSVFSNRAGTDAYQLTHDLAVSASGGSLKLSTGIDVTLVDLWTKNGWIFGPTTTTDRALNVPGVHYQHWMPRLAEQAKWALEVSLLIPFFLTGILALFCGYRYWLIRKVTWSETPRTDPKTSV